MTHDRDFFTPDDVDDQVEYMYQAPREERFMRSERDAESTPSETRLVRDLQAYYQVEQQQVASLETRLVRDLQAYYQVEQQQDLASLESAWKRISNSLPEKHASSRSTKQPLSTNMLRFPQERTRMMRNPDSDSSTRGKFTRCLGLLAAVLMAVLLVGGLVGVLNLSHRTSRTASKPVTSTPTAKPRPVGTTLYTTPPVQYGFNALAWSPDSQRVAASENGSVQIWDATTGAHLVTVQMPSANEWAYDLDWSPTSQEVAIGTNQHLLIVDGQTGKVLHTYAANVPTASEKSSPSGGFLSSQLPASGGYGYRSVAWSPDGHQLGAALSLGVSGEVQVWDVQKGSVAYTLQIGGSHNIGSLDWSSDGEYIAAGSWNTQESDPNQPTDLVVAWQVSTHQMVFEHQTSLVGSDTAVAWQPQSHNLAFTNVTGNDLAITLEIWNAVTGKQVKQYQGMGSQTLAWSPDGKELIYAGSVEHGKNNYINAVVAIDASTGQQIYAYTKLKQNASALAWSPNGKYIVSGEAGAWQQVKGQMQSIPGVATVWVAP